MAPPPDDADGEAVADRPSVGFSLQASKGKRNGAAAAFGIEFVYVHAALEFEGRKFPDVAVRYKGNGSFLVARNSLLGPGDTAPLRLAHAAPWSRRAWASL